MKQCTERLKNKTVSISLDACSNVHNEPIVCSSVVLPTSESFPVDSVDTSGHPHDNEYLTELAIQATNKCQDKFGAHVKSLVTDNASNVAKMTRNLENMGRD